MRTATGPSGTSTARSEPDGSVDEFRHLRILLVHEWLYTWAGAERVLEQLVALLPHADVLAAIVTPAMRQAHPIARGAKESWVGALPGARRHHRWFLPVHAMAFAGYDTRAYDLIISVSHAFEKAVRVRKAGGVHLSYCLSPPRYLWDLRASHDALARPIQRTALRLARPALRAIDRRAAAGVDSFVSLSGVVADRVRRAYHRESSVVYPPVAHKPGIGAATGDRRQGFLLSLGRLVPYKRVDLAIKAAERLGVRLVVAGEGSERARLQKLAGTGTEFVGRVTEERAAELLSTCAAFMFCGEEDFGIAPLEANAHGAPVIALGRGAVLETLRDGQTATFFDEPTVEAAADATARCLATSWDAQALRANAERFSPARFRAEMRDEIRRALR